MDQSIQQDFAPLEKVIHKINVSKDDKSTILLMRCIFRCISSLVGDDDKEHFSELFTPDFFDLIIVDECHRGSAKEESRWPQDFGIFQFCHSDWYDCNSEGNEVYFQSKLFWRTIYMYSLKEGIEDGFLAPFKVINIMTDIGDGWRPRKGQRDIYGNEIEDRIYTNSIMITILSSKIVFNRWQRDYRYLKVRTEWQKRLYFVQRKMQLSVCVRHW